MSKIKENKAFYGDPDLLAQGFLNCSFVFDPGNDDLKGGAYTLRSWKDDFYEWQNGCWMRLSDAEMKRKVTKHMQALNDNSQDSEQQITVTAHKVNNVLLNLKGRIGIPEATELNTWPDLREKIYNTIAVNNGLLMIRKNGKEQPHTIEHTPKFFGVVKLPFDFDPNAICPRWLNFLDEVMQSDREFILLLQQFAGYLFRTDLRLQKFLLCCGEGSNGKTVFFDVVAALVGKENVSEVPLYRFGYPFSLFYTLGKVVNMTHESSSIIEDEAETILKSFVTGDTLQFERKFKDPLFARPTAKIMVATNALPRFNDKTRAIWRRILLIPFDKVIADEAQITDLAEKLKIELPGILNWALEGLKKLNEAGRFIEPEKQKELIEGYRKDCDPSRAFLLDNYMFSPNGYVTPSKEVYEQYRQYCIDNGYKALGSRFFGRQVKRVFPDVNKARPGSRDREYVYEGLVSYQVPDEVPV